MAILDSFDILDRLGLRTTPGGFGTASPTAAQFGAQAAASAAQAASTVAPATAQESLLARIKNLAKAPFSPAAIGAQLGLFSPDAGAGSDVITDATTGKPLPRGGEQLTAAQVNRADAPVNRQLTPEQIAATDSFADQSRADKQIAALDAQNAAAQKVTDARTARVNEVIEQSRQRRVVDEAPRVDFKLGQDFSTLGQFAGQVANRISFNQAQSAERAGKFKQQELDILGAKAAAAFRPELKQLGSVENLQGKQPIFSVGGQILTAGLDDKGNVIQRPVTQAVNRDQVLAAAKEAFKNATTRAEEKQIQEKLKAAGINEKLTK